MFTNSVDKELTSIGLTVVPRNPPIDISMNFYEPQNSQARIAIPCDFKTRPAESYCSDPNTVCEFDEDDRIQIDLKTGPENSSTSLYIFIYGDNFNANLNCVLKINIHSLLCIYTRTRVGIEMEQTLPLDSAHKKTDMTRNVVLYSSNSRYVQTTQEPFVIHPGAMNVVRVKIQTFERDYKKVKVNAVD